jgi:hypothetical protein
VGLTGAAKILGIAPPNISRLRAAGRMPQGIPVEGSADVYVKSEVVALARELRASASGGTGSPRWASRSTRSPSTAT